MGIIQPFKYDTFKNVLYVFLFESWAAQFFQDWEMCAELLQGSQYLLKHCIMGRNSQRHRWGPLLPPSDFFLGYSHLKLSKNHTERVTGATAGWTEGSVWMKGPHLGEGQTSPLLGRGSTVSQKLPQLSQSLQVLGVCCHDGQIQRTSWVYRTNTSSNRFPSIDLLT